MEIRVEIISNVLPVAAKRNDKESAFQRILEDAMERK
jgi:hypothetical protein